VNYVDQGPANGVAIDLAASEFDPTLLSNMNFKHPDSFQLSILTSGLEEVRAVLAYQVMQKHLLIVACHTTQLMIDQHKRAISEIDLLRDHKISVPNPMESVNSFYSGNNHDNISTKHLDDYRKDYKSNMSGQAGDVMICVNRKKETQRASMGKMFSDYQF
jgi:hypothetical protein